MNSQFKGLLINLLMALIAADSFAEGFDQTLEAGDFSFRIQSANNSSINHLTLTPFGLELNNESIQQEVDGTITNAEIGDLDANGFPEIYIYVSSAGSGSYGSLTAWAVNEGKSISPVYLPALDDDPTYSRGYMGHDTFFIEQNTLIRRFPIYQQGDTNSNPSGGHRQLHYKLKPGEAGWVLSLEKLIILD
jgi:hypothetical protein